MKQYHRVLLAIGLSWGMLLGAARGESPITNTIKTAVAIDAGTGKLIDDTVADNFKKLVEGDPAAQTQARDALGNDCRASSGDPSAAFAARYAGAVNARALTLFSSQKAPIRARLNAAIAVQKVAENTKSSKLEAVVLVLLNDKQPEPLKVWGVKAAKGIMPELVKLNAQQKVVDRIHKIVKSNPSGGIAYDAYEALTVMNPAMIDELLKLAETRIVLYETVVPEDPFVEAMPFRAMTSGEAVNLLTAPQQKKVMSLAYKILKLGAAHAEQLPPASGTREQLRGLLTGITQCLDVIAKRMNLPALQAAAQIGWKTMQNARGNFDKIVQPVCDEIKKLPGLENLEEPKLDPAASAPATNPAQ